MTEITRILKQIENGSADSVNQLLGAVYDELRELAAARLANEQVGYSLAATGLVHEAYLRLAGNQSFESRRHFFGAAAEAMRRILIDRARSRNAEKRGGGAARVELAPDHLLEQPSTDNTLLQLNDALERLAGVAPEKAELVKLRYFAGLTIREASEILEISTATADRNWAYAKAWLQSEMRPE